MKKVVLLLAAALFLAANTANAKDTNGTLKVQGSCNMCKTNIEKAAKSVEGVKVAEWDKETKVLRLRYDSDKAKLDAVSKAVAQAGYDTNKDKAGKEAYDGLKPCCKYRE
jgi:copper chaperone CopZ